MAADRTNSEFYLDLPEDPEEAYVAYHRTECERLEQWHAEQQQGWWGERQFVDALTAFDEVYALGAFTGLGEPPSDDSSFSGYFHPFKRSADKFALKIRLEHTRKAKSADLTIMVLDSEAKKAIRQFVEAIREQLEAADLPEGKRRALFVKLNAFAAELDQNLTRTDALFEFVVRAARTFGEAGAEFKPVAERVDRILDLIDRAQKWFDSLPPWTSRKALEKPAKRIEGPNADELVAVDDEIPF